MADDTMFNEAIGAIRQGDKERGRDLLTRLLKADQANPAYWLWMSTVVDSTRERVYCLQEALRRDPQNESAHRGLALLGIVPPDPGDKTGKTQPRRNWQAQVKELVAPDPAIPAQARPRLMVWGGVGLVLLCLVAFVIIGLNSPMGSALGWRNLPPTAAPSATYLPTTTPVIRTPTPTFVGPTPLWMLLPATYTPTPLYVNTPHPLAEAYRSGLHQYELKNWTGTIDFMKQVMASDPGAVDALYYIGEAYRMQGKIADAINAYEQALQINSGFAPAYLGRARANLAADPKADIAADLDQALAADPNFLDALLEKAAFAIRAGDAQTANQNLDPAAALQPDSPLVHLYRAQAHLLVGEDPQALDEARRANELDLTLLPVYRVLGEALQANGQSVESIQPLQTYTLYETGDASAFVLLARAYRAKPDVQAALAAYGQAQQIDPQLLGVYVERGELYLAQNDPQNALNDFSEAGRLSPTSFVASLGKGRALLMNNQAGEAYQQVERSSSLVQTDPERAALHYWRAQALDAYQRPDDAQKDWQALLDLPAGSAPEEWLAQARTRLEPTPAPGSEQQTSVPNPSDSTQPGENTAPASNPTQTP